MKFKVEHNSIKRRLIVLFLTVICLVWVLSVSYVINTVSLKNDLTTIEDPTALEQVRSAVKPVA